MSLTICPKSGIYGFYPDGSNVIYAIEHPLANPMTVAAQFMGANPKDCDTKLLAGALLSLLSARDLIVYHDITDLMQCNKVLQAQANNRALLALVTRLLTRDTLPEQVPHFTMEAARLGKGEKPYLLTRFFDGFSGWLASLLPPTEQELQASICNYETHHLFGDFACLYCGALVTEDEVIEAHRAEFSLVTSRELTRLSIDQLEKEARKALNALGLAEELTKEIKASWKTGDGLDLSQAKLEKVLSSLAWSKKAERVKQSSRLLVAAIKQDLEDF